MLKLQRPMPMDFRSLSLSSRRFIRICLISKKGMPICYLAGTMPWRDTNTQQRMKEEGGPRFRMFAINDPSDFYGEGKCRTFTMGTSRHFPQKALIPVCISVFPCLVISRYITVVPRMKGDRDQGI